jgi:hypothetical protein
VKAVPVAKKEIFFATPIAAKSENKVGTDNSKKSKKAKRKAAPDNDEDFLFASPKGKAEPDRGNQETRKDANTRAPSYSGLKVLLILMILVFVFEESMNMVSVIIYFFHEGT